MSEVWRTFLATQRQAGATDEALSNEAGKRATDPLLYDCALAVWELDRPDFLRAALESGEVAADAPTPRTGQPLLFLAIRKGRAESLQLLLEAGADPARGHKGHDYLYWAVFADVKPAVVLQVLRASESVGIAPTEETLETARRRARPETVSLLERWMAGERDASDVVDERPHDGLAEGDRVTVTAGKLAGCRGVIMSSVEGTSKLRVSVDLFGRAVEVELEPGEIERVE